MKIITFNTQYEETIKKSRFITFLYKISSKEEASEILKKIKEEYKDSTHICYGYILNESTYKYSDDKEPTNSAGLPIYQVLKNNNLVYILAIVIRYYGGIKLGVGGLVHAYSSGVINALKQVNIIPYIKTNNYILTCNYSIFDSLNHYLNKKGITILQKQFLDNIYLSINCDELTINEIKEVFPNILFNITE